MFSSPFVHRQKPYELAVQLLRVNQQVHDEAARVLYGDNDFTFQAEFFRYSNIASYGVRYPQYFNFVDSFLNIAPHYLRMIRTCYLQVSPPLDRPQYLRVLEGISLLAEILREGHSLKFLTVSFGDIWQSSFMQARASKFENVLEPLGTVQRIRHVQIKNVTPEFEVKLTLAMKGSEVACTLAEERFVTKMRKFRGRKRPRVVRMKKYYESRYDWKDDAPAL